MPSERLRWRQVRATTPFRLTLVLGVVSLAGLWATLSLGYLLTARELTARSDRILRARAAVLQSSPPALLPARIRADVAAAVGGVTHIALEGRDGEVVAGDIRLATLPPPGRPFSLPARAGNHGPLRVLIERTSHGELIVLARDTSQIEDLRHQLLLILIGSGIIGTTLTLATAVALSLPAIRRVRDLTRASRAIAAGDFATRMPIAGRHDELDQFASTVNRMIEEVAHLVAQVKTATDAVAHDLRTPLTRTRAALARIGRSPELSADLSNAVDRAAADLDAVIGRFAALMRLSELEASDRRAGLRSLDPGSLAAEVAQLWEPLAEERGIALLFEDAGCLPVEADRELLFEAVGNLVDNAIKFSCSHVSVRVGSEGGQSLIEVIDDGPGIPPGEREAVFRRFHRARGAAGVEGTGLGLAVASAILHLHGFDLGLTDAGPGLIARVRMTAAE